MTLTNCPFDLTPIKESEDDALFRLKNINYTNQDFHSLKTRMVKLIQERYPSEFADFVEGDLGIMLIEMYAFLTDMLSFKMDFQANEIYIDTIGELENMFRLAKLVGYDPTPPIPSKASFSASISSVLPTNLVIPTPILLEIGVSGETLEYELFPADSNNNPIFDEDIVILQGSLFNNSVVGVEGRTIIDSFTGNGTPNQTLSLNSAPVIYDSIRVEIDGVAWTNVKFFTDSQPRNEFRVEFNSNYEAFIIFGNNRSGFIPSNGSQIRVIYRIGGGRRGNIISSAFDSQINVPLEGFDFFIPVRFTNFTKGDFGYDGDGIEEIRSSIPRYLATQDRLVSGKDIKSFTDLFKTAFNGQIGKSNAILRNYGCAGNIIDLYILVKDGISDLIEANSSLKSELLTAIEDKKMMTEYICIRDGVVISVDVNLDIKADKFYRKVKEEIENKINTKISTFFSLSNWDYNQNLRDYDIVKVLSDITEIREVDVSFTTIDPDNSGSLVSARYFEIIRPDQVVITFTFE